MPLSSKMRPVRAVQFSKRIVAGRAYGTIGGNSPELTIFTSVIMGLGHPLRRVFLVLSLVAHRRSPMYGSLQQSHVSSGTRANALLRAGFSFEPDRHSHA